MVAVLAVGFVANLLVRPVAESSTNPPNGPRRVSGGPGERAGPGGSPAGRSSGSLAYGVVETLVRASRLFTG